MHKNKMSRAAAGSRSRLSRIATPNAATPRAGILIPEAQGPFKPETADQNLSLGGSRGPFSFAKENGPLVRVPCAALGTRSSALRCRNAILHTFHRAVNNNSASFIWKESISIWKSEKNSGARCRL